MMLHLFKRWGIETTTDNIADAVGLALMGLCALGAPKFTDVQREIAAGVTEPKVKKSKSKSKSKGNS